MDNIADSIASTLARIAAAARAAGRDPTDVRLIAVSKTKPAPDIRAAYAAGQRAFGENFVQEAAAKISELALADAEWHFIGRLQSNKTADVARLFDWVHGLASLRHAERLSAQRPAGVGALNCCIQVNLSGEASKSGVAAGDAESLVRAIMPLPSLRVRGLMTMPNPHDPPDRQRGQYRSLRELRDTLNRQTGAGLDTLSMGMSADLEAAVAEGATMVRIGTAIFGQRN